MLVLIFNSCASRLFHYCLHCCVFISFFVVGPFGDVYEWLEVFHWNLFVFGTCESISMFLCACVVLFLKDKCSPTWSELFVELWVGEKWAADHTWSVSVVRCTAVWCHQLCNRIQRVSIATHQILLNFMIRTTVHLLLLLRCERTHKHTCPALVITIPFSLMLLQTAS